MKWWRYVVLEEIVNDVALLRRWAWPLADDRGHLVWPREEQLDSTAIPISALRDQLYRPSKLEREPRIGDTFAVVAESAGRSWPSSTGDLTRLVGGRIFDVSAEARLAARLAYHGSIAAVLGSSPRVAEEGEEPVAKPRQFRAPELTVAPAAPSQRSKR